MSKIYTIGDIHGDYDKLCDLLTKHNLINTEKDWIGGQDTLLCVGDLMDRGHRGIDVLNLFMKLEVQAQKENGNLISLMGNHDALMAARAYIQREEWYNHDCVLCFNYNGGIFEELETIAEDEQMLNWLKNRPLMHKQNNILFQHADSAKYYLSFGRDVDEINKNGLAFSQSADGAWQIFYDMTDSRFWDRPFLLDEDDTCSHIDHYLDTLGVNKVVHGHTRNISNFPVWYYAEKICNVDGSLSCGYREDPDRGFIVVFDEDGNEINCD